MHDNLSVFHTFSDKLEADLLSIVDIFTGIPVMEFTQSDIAASQVQYIHTSESEDHLDSFTFSVSDGTNDVLRSFTIQISPVDDSIPVVTNRVLRVQEGVRKLITEFDLKATDEDTKVHL